MIMSVVCVLVMVSMPWARNVGQSLQPPAITLTFIGSITSLFHGEYIGMIHHFVQKFRIGLDFQVHFLQPLLPSNVHQEVLIRFR